jgi:hypothetical protein
MTEVVMDRDIFKICPMCSTQWKTRDDFMKDRLLHIDGYQADFEKLEWSLFYFTHHQKDCLSTMTIEAKDFLDLYSGKKYSERRTGQEDCPGFCLEKEQLARCEALCECAFNREIIQAIKEKQQA